MGSSRRAGIGPGRAGASVNVLFVCSRNRRRSLTAESIFDGANGHRVRSAGTEPGARVRVDAGRIGWAELIFVMEDKHRSRLRSRFRDAIAGKRIVCLHIRDDYEFLDETLIGRLRVGVAPHVDFGDAAGRSSGFFVGGRPCLGCHW